jgi:SAM-dependent methyltransferase
VSDQAIKEAGEVRDRWAAWLLERRHGGNADLRKAMLPDLEGYRARVLDRALVRPGDVLLDVGTGDGLIAFAAVELVGPSGRVIFSDISKDLLDHCRELAGELGITDRSRFVIAAADDLGEIEDASVDIVTTRSVLIYVTEKRRAMAEFYRVLRPLGRISILEPINRLMYPEPPNELVGVNVSEVRDLADKVKAVADRTLGGQVAMLDFDDRDLLDIAEGAGFRQIHLALEREIVEEHRPWTWESLLATSGNPLAPTFGDLIRQALTTDEMQRFEAHMKPLVESGTRIRRMSMAHLWAEKPA